MRTKVIPAEITSVEDKIAGNLSFLQLLLLVAGLLTSAFVFVIFPKPLSLSFYKLFMIPALLLIFSTLAIRIRGNLVLSWIILLLAYVVRPRIWVFNKNNTYLRS